MELQFNKVQDVSQVPTAHRGNGAVTDALTTSYVTFGETAKLGEWFWLDVDNVQVHMVALRNAAAEMNTGVSLRTELSEPDKVRTNRKGETVKDEKQAGRVWFAFKTKRAVKPGAAKPGRKPASAKK